MVLLKLAMVVVAVTVEAAFVVEVADTVADDVAKRVGQKNDDVINGWMAEWSKAPV